jgi:purine nucleosidase
MAPLDVTHRAMATPERVARLRARGGEKAVAVADLLAFFDRKDPARYGSHGAPVHDPTVIAYLLRPELFTVRRAFVEVCCTEGPAFGQTVADWWGITGKTPNVDVLVGIDADGFFDLLGDLLSAP